MIFGIHCNILFKQTSSFPKFSVRTSCEKIYWHKLQLYLLASYCSSYQNVLWQKFDSSRNTSSKNSDQLKIILTNMFNTKYSLASCCRKGANFRKKTPQVHLIIIRQWPKNNPSPILRNLDNFSPGAREYYIKYNGKYTNSCHVFFFFQFQTKKWSYHWIKIIAGDWVTISVAEFLFQIFSYVRRIWFIV